MKVLEEHLTTLTLIVHFHNIGNMDTRTALKALAALAQENRLAIFRLLVEQGPSGFSAGVIGEKLGLANATLSFHLKELTQSGLLTARQESRFIYYAANVEAMNTLMAYLTENCCAGSNVTCVIKGGPACAPAVKIPSRRRKKSHDP